MLIGRLLSAIPDAVNNFIDTNQVVAEIEAVTAAEIAPVTNSSSAPAEVFISSM